MKGSAQGLLFNLCGCTHGSERDFSFNSRTSEISRYLHVLCRLDCRVPVCCWQALFYSFHWQEKVTLQEQFPCSCRTGLASCAGSSDCFFPIGSCITDRCRHTHKELWCRKKKPLRTFLFSPTLCKHWPLTSVWVSAITSFTGRKAIFHG